MTENATDSTEVVRDVRARYVDVTSMPWQPTAFPGIEMKILYSDPTSGMSTILFKMAPGAQVPLHEHAAVEQTYMLSGALVDEEGVATEGNFVWRPGGNTHVARAPEGAVFLAVFMKPNRFAAGTRFFTEAAQT
jgi:anti-sigma factor ChrR (cupin superfamily)